MDVRDGAVRVLGEGGGWGWAVGGWVPGRAGWHREVWPLLRGSGGRGRQKGG